MSELMACPFCGSMEVVLGDDNTHVFWIGCNFCGARGPMSDTAQEAKYVWNKAKRNVCGTE